MTDETLTQLEYITIILHNRKIKPTCLVKPMAQDIHGEGVIKGTELEVLSHYGYGNKSLGPTN